MSEPGRSDKPSNPFLRTPGCPLRASAPPGRGHRTLGGATGAKTEKPHDALTEVPSPGDGNGETEAQRRQGAGPRPHSEFWAGAGSQVPNILAAGPLECPGLRPSSIKWVTVLTHADLGIQKMM